MSRNPNSLASFTLVEDRLTALLVRIDAAAGVLTEQAAREVSSQGDSRAATVSGAVLEQLRRLSQLLDRQEVTERENSSLATDWLPPLQEQLSRIEQHVEELRKPVENPATFG